MPGRVRNAERENIAAALKLNISTIFDQVQASTANHHKNIVALSKLQVEAAQHTEPTRDGNFKLIGERMFEDAFQLALMRVLPVKKGVAPADRIVKFIGGYIKFINERAMEEKIAQGTQEDDDEGTTAGRFTAKLLRFLLRGFSAKDKSVRYRTLQVVAETVSHLGEIDEDIYVDLRTCLLERVNDREIPVRVQAFIGLSKLCGSEDPTEAEENEVAVVDILIDNLCHDPSVDVRRAILLNIPLTSVTIPHIIDRSRDKDNIVRKLVYSAVLEPNVFQGESLVMGPTHPRSLTIAQRELIVRNGLGDREATVRTAAGNLIATWVDTVRPPTKAEDDTKAEDNVKAEAGVLDFLGLFYLGESSIAADALLSVFTTRVDIFESIEFGGQYWAHLTPETAFLARVFVEHCRATKDEIRLEAALPVVTALAFGIQEACNGLLIDIQAEDEDGLLGTNQEAERIQREDQRVDKEFVLAEMLKLAVHLDYADEIGRRKMFQLVRDMISQEALSDNLLAGCLDVLRILSASERDLIRVVVETVQDLRDPGDDENDDENESEQINTEDTPLRPTGGDKSRRKSRVDISPESKARADKIDLKCLSLCIRMLERVNGMLEDNIILAGILDELIYPSLHREEANFRQKALTSFGLCCLIDKRLARGNLTFFWERFKKEPVEAIKIDSLRIVLDLLLAHESVLRADDVSQVITNLIKCLGAEIPNETRALLSIGISKLVLSGVIHDICAIKNLIVVYFSPATADNQELLQCLTFFLQVYGYSSHSNQQRIQKIFIDLFMDLKKRHEELEEDEGMVSLSQIGAMFVDWTNPLKLSPAASANTIASETHMENESIHIDLAIDIFKAMLEHDDLEREDKKVLCQILSKLHIPDTVDDDKIRTLKLYIHHVHLRRPLHDTVTNNAFTKFDTLISKKFEKQLEDFSEEEYRKLEELKDLFEFLDSVAPEDEDTDVPKKRGRKRMSESVAKSSSEEFSDSPPTSRRSRKNKSKRLRLSTSDDSDVAEIDPPRRGSTAPIRTMPKRSAATKQPQIIEISSDSDDATPKPKPKLRSTIKSEHARDDISAADEDAGDVSSEIPFDSIMDPDPDSEEEVNDLLAEE